MRFRLIMEIEFAGATDEHDDEIRSHLASFVHAAAGSGMLTSDALDADEIEVAQLGVHLERLLDPEPEDDAGPTPAPRCVECGEWTGDLHLPGCGKRDILAPHVVQDDCEEDEG